MLSNYTKISSTVTTVKDEQLPDYIKAMFWLSVSIQPTQEDHLSFQELFQP